MAAPDNVTRRGMMVSVTGVTPFEPTGMAVSVSLPRVNDRERLADALPDTELARLEDVGSTTEAEFVVEVPVAAAERDGDGEGTGVEAGKGNPVEEVEMA